MFRSESAKALPNLIYRKVQECFFAIEYLASSMNLTLKCSSQNLMQGLGYLLSSEKSRGHNTSYRQATIGMQFICGCPLKQIPSYNIHVSWEDIYLMPFGMRYLNRHLKPL